jgi:hypothetical protein
VSPLLPRPVRRDWQTHAPQVPGHTGERAPPSAAVGVALGAPGAGVYGRSATTAIPPMYGRQAHHLLVWVALDLDHTWDEAPMVQKNTEGAYTP